MEELRPRTGCAGGTHQPQVTGLDEPMAAAPAHVVARVRLRREPGRPVRAVLLNVARAPGAPLPPAWAGGRARD